MKQSYSPGATVLALVAVAVLLPATALAQQLSDPVLDREHDEAVAVAYGGTPGAIEQAVFRHGQVVHQRMRHDERRFECLKSHANLLYYYGRLNGARLYMEAAAEQAVAEGQDYDAAMTYIDAAILAKEAGDVRAVQDLANRAMQLGSSPRVPSDQRSEILARIGQ